MANEVLPLGLTAALESVGNAHIFAGSFIAANSAMAVGQKEGAIEVGGDQQWNQLTAPEYTGPMIHDETLDGESLVVTVPMIVPADGSFWADFSAFGSSGMGYSYPQVPTDTMVAIIPDREVGGGLKYETATWTRLAGNGVGAASGAGAAPKNALWIWRARMSYGKPLRFDRANGGKMIVPVTIQGKYRQESTAGNDLPEGHHLATWGDPAAAAVVGFAFSQA